MALQWARSKWIAWNERRTGLDHPDASASGASARPDVTNRPLRDALTVSGYSPDAFTGFHPPVYSPLAYAAASDIAGLLAGTTSIAAALAEAVSAASAAGRGVVMLPAGTLSIGTTTITIPSAVEIRGMGAHLTRVAYTGTGTAFHMAGGSYRGLSSLTVDIGSSASAIGVRLSSPDANNWNQWNRLCEVRVTAPAIVAGQIGLQMDATAGGNVTYNRIYGFSTYLVARPIVLDTVEANAFVDVNLADFGTGGTAFAIDSTGSTDQFYGCWFGRGSSTAGALIGFRFTGEDNIAFGNADLGAGSLAYDAGDNNVVFGVVRSPTTYGSRPGITSFPFFGQAFDSSAYMLPVIGNSGADRFLLQTGIAGVSNGFSTRYTHATQRFTYELLQGDVVAEGYFQGAEIADPAAPAANMGRLYFRDNGAGKTQLVARFPTGAVQVIATEP